MSPYPSQHTNSIYEMLFCDNIKRYNEGHSQPEIYPWNVLFSENPSVEELMKIAHDPTLESRISLLAYQLLRSYAYPVEKQILLGVIVEVALNEGLDVLAAYLDGTARYINHTGSMLIWEAPNATSRALTTKLFEASDRIVKQIGPWDKHRLPPPATGNVRITFLVSDGLYFGEGPQNVLFNDPLAKPALAVATELMIFSHFHQIIMTR